MEFFDIILIWIGYIKLRDVDNIISFIIICFGGAFFAREIVLI